MNLSQRALGIQASPIRKLAPLMVAAKRRGVAIHHLNIGQPDIPTPASLLGGLKHYQDPVLSYGPSDGLPELEARHRGLFLPLRHRIWTPPMSSSPPAAARPSPSPSAPSADPGDEVIVPEPFYTNYNGFATLAA